MSGVIDPLRGDRPVHRRRSPVPEPVAGSGMSGRPPKAAAKSGGMTPSAWTFARRFRVPNSGKERRPGQQVRPGPSQGRKRPRRARGADGSFVGGRSWSLIAVNLIQRTNQRTAEQRQLLHAIQTGQTRLIATSMLPRVAFEYGHIRCASLTIVRANSRSTPGRLTSRRARKK